MNVEINNLNWMNRPDAVSWYGGNVNVCLNKNDSLDYSSGS